MNLKHTGPFLLGALGITWVALAIFWASPAPFSVDDLVYQAMIDAFARDRSLFVSNGFEASGSPYLKPVGMRVANGHLAPQYPSGWAIFAAPAYVMGGFRGVVLLNALASALTLPLIWLAARALFDDQGLARRAALIWALATFAVDYALGFWPHAVAAFLVTTAITAIALGWRGTEIAELRGALVAGLAIGLAINVRVDAILAIGGLIVWQMAVTRRPFMALGWFAIGLVPGVAVATLLNYLKLGIPSPLSYGVSSGPSSLGNYAVFLPMIVAGALAALALGFRRVRVVAFRPMTQLLVLVGFVGLIIGIPELRGLATRIIAGLHVLVIDFQALPISGDLPAGADPHGIAVMEDGTIRMFGFPKKALLQSMPYAAAVILLAPRLIRGPDRAALSLCILMIAPFLVFFSINTFHGGMANNMRYFLSILPVVAILAAAALRELRLPRAYSVALSVVAALCVLIISSLYASANDYGFVFAVQQTLPNAVAVTIAGLSIAVFATRGALRAVSANALHGIAVLGLVVATISAWGFDLYIARHVRAENAKMIELTADLPLDAFVVTYTPEKAGFRMNRPPAVTAQANFVTRSVDPTLVALVEDAIAEGRPVFIQSRALADQMADNGLQGRLKPRYGIADYQELYEVIPYDESFPETR